jgi:ABC-type cobalamin transport system permease subunit
MQNRRIKLLPLKNGASGGAVTYLKVEKPRFLFLEGSTGAVLAVAVATAALPDASMVRAGASVARTAPSVDRLPVGTSAPALGACSSAASAALGEGSAGSHL